MRTPTTGALRPQSKLSTLAFSLSALLLGGASVTTATLYGLARGTDSTTSLVWAAVGLAAGLVTLTAPAEAIQAVTRRQFGRAATAATAAVLCGAFAIAGALGSASSGRQLATDSAESVSAGRERALDSYKRASSTLAALPSSRSSAELTNRMIPLDARIRGADCGGWVLSKDARAACAARNTLQVELARAQQRAELELAIAKAGASLAAAPPAAAANQDSVSLARYAKALGIDADPAGLNDLLTILAVLVVEIGFSLSVSLIRYSVSEHRQFARYRNTQ